MISDRSNCASVSIAESSGPVYVVPLGVESSMVIAKSAGAGGETRSSLGTHSIIATPPCAPERRGRGPNSHEPHDRNGPGSSAAAQRHIPCPNRPKGTAHDGVVAVAHSRRISILARDSNHSTPIKSGDMAVGEAAAEGEAKTAVACGDIQHATRRRVARVIGDELRVELHERAHAPRETNPDRVVRCDIGEARRAAAAHCARRVLERHRHELG